MKISRLTFALAAFLLSAATASAADRYVSASGSTTSPYDTWAKASTTLQTAIAGSAAGDRFLLDKTIAESIASAQTLTFPGTIASPNQILSVTNTGSPVVAADLSAGASYATTGNNAITIAGTIYANGWTVTVGTGAVSSNLNLLTAALNFQIFENCVLQIGGTSTGAIVMGPGSSANSPQRVDFLNTNVGFAHVNGDILVKGPLYFNWLGGSLIGTSPTTLFSNGGGTPAAAQVVVRDVDLSLMGAAKILVNVTNVAGAGLVTFANNKVNASLGAVSSGTNSGPGATDINFIISDSTGAVTREEHYQYAGNIKQDTTVTRSGGATDGTTAKSWIFTTLAATSRLKPLVSPDIVQWVAAGTKVCTVQIATNNVTMQDIDIWLDIEYLGSASTPQGTFTRQTNGGALPNVIATGTNLATVATTWNSVPGTPVKQAVSSGSLVFNLSGYVLARVVVAKSSLSSTLWVDPLLTCT